MKTNKILIAVLVGMFGAICFLSGVAAQKNEPTMPNSVIHHVVLKWKEGVSDADKQKALDGLREIVASTPGAKNMWMKSVKIQPKEFNQTFVIEFENQGALDAYGKHPRKKEWDDFYYNIRESSQNCVTTN